MAQSRPGFLPFFAIAAAILAILAGCSKSPAPEHKSEATAPAVNVEWTKFVEEFIDAYFAAQPPFAVQSGKHEFDGQLPDWTPEGIQKEIARLEQARQRAVGFQDSTLAPEERFQRDYVISRVDADLFWLRDARQPFTNPSWYFNTGLDPSTYVTVPYAPADVRLRAFIKYAQQIPGAVAQIKKNVQMPLPKTFIDFSSKSFGGFADFYRKDVPQAFAEVQDAELKKQLADVLEPAAKAMQDYAKWLAAQKPGKADGYVLGPERFAAMVRMTENVTTSVDKLEEIGRSRRSPTPVSSTRPMRRSTSASTR